MTIRVFCNRRKYLLTSESVTEGHPDKICDQISDAVLDAIMKHDPEAHVACETAVTNGLVVVLGEITTSTYVEIPEIVRERDHATSATPDPRVRLRVPVLRRDDLHQQAVPRYRPGRQQVAGGQDGRAQKTDELD